MGEYGGDINRCVCDLYRGRRGRRVSFGVSHGESEFKRLAGHQYSVQVNVRLAVSRVDGAREIFDADHVTAVICGGISTREKLFSIVGLLIRSCWQIPTVEIIIYIGSRIRTVVIMNRP